MFAFTAEQLETISGYPPAVVDVANKAITKELHAGKKITSPFNYFVAICRAEIQKQNNPKTGKTKSQSSFLSPINHGKQSSKLRTEWQAPSAAQESYNRLMKIYKRQLILHNRGHEWYDLTPEELRLTVNGYLSPKILRADRLPPVEPIYKDEVEYVAQSTLKELLCFSDLKTKTNKQ